MYIFNCLFAICLPQDDLTVSVKEQSFKELIIDFMVVSKPEV